MSSQSPLFPFQLSSPCDLRATPLAFPFWRPVPSSFCNGSFLEGGMANSPPASPHQDGSHWFGSTPFKEILVGNDIRPKDAYDTPKAFGVKGGEL